MKDFCSEKDIDSHLGKNEKKFLFRVFVLSSVLSQILSGACPVEDPEALEGRPSKDRREQGRRCFRDDLFVLWD